MSHDKVLYATKCNFIILLFIFSNYFILHQGYIRSGDYRNIEHEVGIDPSQVITSIMIR